ncbi:MAG: pilus assembly protein TadG-related protein [Nocardioides sp.]
MRRLRGQDRDERGAVAVMVAGLVVVMLAVAAFAVDLGMQRVVRSDMQAMADVVALDSARLIDGRTAKEIRDGSGGIPALQATAEASASRNQSTLGDGTVQAVLVYLDKDSNGAMIPKRAAGVLVPVPDSARPDAVLITATGGIEFAFAPGSGSATRTALGTASSYGCFRLGSFAASLQSDSALGGVFESLVSDALGINLRAIGYGGLLSSSIGIAGLAANLGVGTPQELANLKGVKVADLFRASAQVLDSQGNSSASAAMASIASKVSQSTVLDLGSVLAVGDGAALVGTINALDLVGSAGIAASTVLANGNNFLDTGVAWAAPRVSSGAIELRAVAAPPQYCGPIGGGTSTAQVSFISDFGFNLPNKVQVGSLGDLSVGTQADLTTTQASMHVDATLAGATGKLVGVTCGAGTAASPQVTKVNVDTSLLTGNVRLPFRVKGTLDVGTNTIVPTGVLSSLFGILQTDATVALTLDLNGLASASLSTAPQVATGPTLYSVPPLTYGQAQPSLGSGQPVSLPTPAVTLETSGSVSVSVTTKIGPVSLTTTKSVPTSSLNLTALLSAITSSAIGTSTQAVVSNVNQALVPVSKLLGIRVAGADVIGTFPPSCSSPKLAG